jgi:phosphatidate cytidylyltransferase
MYLKLFYITSGLFVIGALLMCMVHYLRLETMVSRRNDWIKYTAFIVIVALVLLVTNANSWGPILLFWSISLIAVCELGIIMRSSSPRFRILATASLALVILGLGHLFLFETTARALCLTFVFLLVATADSFAQLFGRLLGRYRPFPNISPSKTVEGLIGGLIVCLISSHLFAFLLPRYSGLEITILGLITGLSAIAGDLLFSAIKRKLKIKDFSGLIPGHGGILDRFDSLIVAVPVFFWTQRMVLQ